MSGDYTLLLLFILLLHTTVTLLEEKSKFNKGTHWLNAKIESNLTVWVWVIAGIGIFLRLFHFLDNRSLWIDEIALSNSLIRMNFIELAKGPLEGYQKAPIGYLWFSRVFVLLFGKGEMALRLFSFICGILSLVVFIPVTRYFLKPLGVVVAMGILAIATPLVYHAVEAKQYSTELLATVLALYLYVRYHNQWSITSLVFWGIWGAMLVWISYSSIFILAGIAFAVCLSYLFKRDWPSLFRSILPFSLWLISFAVNYVVFTSKELSPDSDWLIYWWRIRGGFMPFPPNSLADIGWFFKTAYLVMRFPLGLLWIYFTHENPLIQLIIRMPMLPLLLAGVGTVALFRNNKLVFMLLTFPCLLTLVASGLELFPFFERLIVFLAPVFILIIAYGCEKTVNLLPTDSRWKYAIPVVLLAGPVMNSAMQLVDPTLFGEHKRSNQREGFLYIHDRLQQGDMVYVAWNNLSAYRFYKESYTLNFEALVGEDVKYVSTDVQDYQQRLDKQIAPLAGKKRVWVVYNKYIKYANGTFSEQLPWYDKEEINPGEILHNRFSAIGKEIDSYDTGEFRVSLFDLSEN